MRRMGGWTLALGICTLYLSGCVYCPWLAKAGDVAECEGSVLDNIDGKNYRLTVTRGGKTKSTVVSLLIQRDDCSVVPPQDLSPFGVEAIIIKNPRSAETGSVVIRTRLRSPDGEPVTCSAPLAELEPLDFICPPQAKLKYLAEPLE